MKKERESSLDAIDAFNEANSSLSGIWEELLSNKNLSPKMRSIYRRKVLFILKKLSIKLEEANKKSGKELHETKIKGKRNILIILILVLISFITLCFNQLFSLIPLLISLNVSFKMFSNASKREIEITKNIEEIIKLTDLVNILTSNITRRLSIENSLEVGKDNNIKEIDLANEIILKYLEDKVLLDMDETTKNNIIKLLQSDLKTDINDLEELLNMASLKENEENISKKKIIK